MSVRKAYLKGLCKSACVKSAALTGSRIGDLTGRYISLLLGSPAVRKSSLKQIKGIDRTIESLSKSMSRLGEAGGPIPDWLPQRIASLKADRAMIYGPIASESRKVHATRLGTALAGLLGVGIYRNNRSED